MKSEVIEDKVQKEISYPWLGVGGVGDKNWEKVVLFIAPEEGVVVNAIGKICGSWGVL